MASEHPPESPSASSSAPESPSASSAHEARRAPDEPVVIVGAGMAGSECAWQLAERGVHVRLLEQKPARRTPAAHLDTFAEMVCSNSMRGAAMTNAVGPGSSASPPKSLNIASKVGMTQTSRMIRTPPAMMPTPAG